MLHRFWWEQRFVRRAGSGYRSSETISGVWCVSLARTMLAGDRFSFFFYSARVRKNLCGPVTPGSQRTKRRNRKAGKSSRERERAEEKRGERGRGACGGRNRQQREREPEGVRDRRSFLLMGQTRVVAFAPTFNFSTTCTISTFFVAFFFYFLPRFSVLFFHFTLAAKNAALPTNKRKRFLYSVFPFSCSW